MVLMPTLETVFWLAAGLLSLAGVGRYIVYPAWKEVRDLMLWWKKFQRDWDGEAEEPGRARVPGVMERLNNIDGQLHRNGGESLKDKVCDTLELTLDLSGRVDVIERRQVDIADRLGKIELRR